MLLGLHTYSFHLHGMGQNWGGHKLQWEPVWDVFGLMDEAKKLSLDGLHLTAADLGQTDDAHVFPGRDDVVRLLPGVTAEFRARQIAQFGVNPYLLGEEQASLPPLQSPSAISSQLDSGPNQLTITFDQVIDPASTVLSSQLKYGDGVEKKATGY